jgi:hypothetical protein
VGLAEINGWKEEEGASSDGSCLLILDGVCGEGDEMIGRVVYWTKRPR